MYIGTTKQPVLSLHTESATAFSNSVCIATTILITYIKVTNLIENYCLILCMYINKVSFYICQKKGKEFLVQCPCMYRPMCGFVFVSGGTVRSLQIEQMERRAVCDHFGQILGFVIYSTVLWMASMIVATLKAEYCTVIVYIICAKPCSDKF